jgi:hypothetical protein
MIMAMWAAVTLAPGLRGGGGGDTRCAAAAAAARAARALAAARSRARFLRILFSIFWPYS